MFEGIPIVDFTAPTLLGFAVAMLLLGKILPRSTYLEKVAEAERWRMAYEAEREARATSDAQTSELLEVSRTTHSVITAMFATIESTTNNRSYDVVPKE